MPTAPYYLDGKKVPSVTTVLGKRQSVGGLMNWAEKCGRLGLDSSAERNAAGLSGSLAHAMIEQHIKDGSESIIPEDFLTEVGDKKTAKLSKEHIARALNEASVAFLSYLAWRETTTLDIVAQEVHLISEEYRYGGTPDAVGLVNDEEGLCLLDWKTSSGIYDATMQVVAYKQLWEETHPDLPIESMRVCRFDKEEVKFEVLHIESDFENEWEAFRLMLELYRVMPSVEKRIRAHKKEMRDAA